MVGYTAKRGTPPLPSLPFFKGRGKLSFFMQVLFAEGNPSREIV
jgi:hypothetical protein